MPMVVEGRRRSSIVWVAAAILMAGCLDPGGQREPDSNEQGLLGPFPSDAEIGATRVFTTVREPGSPEGLVIHGDKVYVGSAELDGPGAVFVYNLSTGEEVYMVPLDAPDQARGANNNGAFALALDTNDHIYAAQQVGARVLRFDIRAPESQETYAQIPDLRPCGLAVTDACAPTVTDERPWVNGLAFGPDGALYVSDLLQATIFRVPPAGGPVEIWYQDARFNGFGPNGLAVSISGKHLYVAHSYFGACVPGAPVGQGTCVDHTAVGRGIVWRLPLGGRPSPSEAEIFHEYPDWALDGITVGASGRIYVTLLDPYFTTGYVSVLDPDGTESTAFPSPDGNERQDVPYHVPGNMAFHNGHRSILVANVATGEHPHHWAVLEAYVDDVAPTHVGE